MWRCKDENEKFGNLIGCRNGRFFFDGLWQWSKEDRDK